MVWSQYVYEASANTEAHSSDDDHTDSEENNPLLNIHTFYDAYSDDLWFLWDVLRQLLDDAFLYHDDMEFHDWLEFCFHEPDTDEHATKRGTGMGYVWDTLCRLDQEGVLQKKRLEDFEEFLLSYSIP
jgi:hypothetical protein